MLVICSKLAEKPGGLQNLTFVDELSVLCLAKVKTQVFESDQHFSVLQFFIAAAEVSFQFLDIFGPTVNHGKINLSLHYDKLPPFFVRNAALNLTDCCLDLCNFIGLLLLLQILLLFVL